MTPARLGEAARPAIPPEGLARRQQWLMVGRLLVVTLLLGATLALDASNLSSFTPRYLLAVIAASYALTGVAAIWLARTTKLAAVAYAQLAVDTLSVAGLIYLTGGAVSGFVFLFGVVILSAALVLDFRATAIVTGVSIFLYLAVGLGLANSWLPHPPDQIAPADVLSTEQVALSLLRSTTGLLLIGGLASALSARLRRTGGQLKEAAAVAAGYARLSEDIIRSLSSGLITADEENRIETLSDAASQLLRDPMRHLIGRDVSVAIPALRDQARLLQPGQAHRAEATIHRTDGTTFPAGFTRTALVSAGGDVRGHLIIFQDLSELTELRSKAEQAERLAALGRLAAGLAHEIRNPLGSISGSVQLVKDAQGLSDEDRRLLSIVVSEVDRVNDLVTTMLDLGRPLQPHPIRFDIAGMLKEVVQVAERRELVGVHRNAIELTVPTDPVFLEADPGQIRQVMWNLIKNALQVSPPGGRVAITLSPHNTAIAVSVRDDGPGIDDADRPRLFDMFFTKRRHGIGLGLAVAKKMIDAHGGQINVTTALGKGSQFDVILPAQTPA